MDKIKSLGNKAIELTKNWYITNWNGGIFDKGKTIFISIIIFFVIIKFIHDLFV